MTKAEALKKLEEKYFEGLSKGLIFADPVSKKYEIDPFDIPSYFLNELDELENLVYDTALSNEEMRRKKPFINAKKTWDSLRKSPLYKALE